MEDRICIFNPEHDICLANGDGNFVPPRSALAFARGGASLMRLVYGEGSKACSVEDFDLSMLETGGRIVAWGWDLVVRRQLLKKGVPERFLPTEEYIDTLRHLQHRSSILCLQPESDALVSVGELERKLSYMGKIVMKAPWSGSGRGIRWVTGELSRQDVCWFEKVVRDQQCVIVEPRREVADDFALEYYCEGENLRFVGYSLFKTQSGVYRHNVLMDDEGIGHLLKSRMVDGSEGLSAFRSRVEMWLKTHVVGRYEGPLGVDFYVDNAGEVFLGEVNFRHTMGLVAHELLRCRPGLEGRLFNPFSFEM